MVIYTQIITNGSNLNNYNRVNINISLSDNNSTGIAKINTDNYNGQNKDVYVLGNELVVYCENVFPPTKKVFGGYVSNIEFIGDQLKERLDIEVRDYTSELQNRKILVEVYTSKTISFIIKDLMAKYGPSDFTVNNVVDIDTVLARISFRQTNLFDAILQLLDLTGKDYLSIVDLDKDLNVFLRETKNSGVTFDNTNCYAVNVTSSTDDVRNRVYVFGGNQYISTPAESFTSDGLGSVFNLKYKPHNTDVTVNGVQQVGDIYNQNIIPASGVQYLVNYDDKQIVFISGTSIPSSGGSIVVNYDLSKQIVKVNEDNDSIVQYKLKEESYTDTNITDPNTALEFAKNKVALLKDPPVEVEVEAIGYIDIDIAEFSTINFPYKNIINKDYQAFEITYDFSQENNFKEKVLKVRFNNRISDIFDTWKDMIDELNKLKSADISEDAILPRITSFTGSIGIGSSNLPSVMIRRAQINDSYVIGHPDNGVLGNVGNKSLFFKFDNSGTYIQDLIYGTSGIVNNAIISGGLGHYSFGSVYVGAGSNSYIALDNVGSYYNSGVWYPGSSLLAASGADDWGWSINSWVKITGSSLGPSGNNHTIIGGRLSDTTVFLLQSSSLYNGIGSYTMRISTDDSGFTSSSFILSGLNNVGVSWKLNSRVGDTGSPFYPYVNFFLNGSLLNAGSYRHATGQPYPSIGALYIGMEYRSKLALNGIIDTLKVYPRFIGSEEHKAIVLDKVSGIQPLLGDRRTYTTIYTNE